MDKRYEVYALADAHFYETPDRLTGDGPAPQFDTARRPVPEGWASARTGDWLTLTPLDADGSPAPGPAQGWKIHASATRANAERIAAIVWDYCVPRRVPFKFVPGPHLLHLRNTKYAGRDTSGKFVTVYPSDEEQLHTVLRELGALLAGFEGPYILTDLRWSDGPLYVRYGAFARSYVVDDRGSLVPAVRDGAGALVPDRRAPSFQVPEWVTLPPFLEPHLAARNTTTVGELPYRIEKALHFSNGGGVYAGTDTRDGRKVVLKEGLPHAGLASTGPTRSPGWSGRSGRWRRWPGPAWCPRCGTGSPSATTASWSWTSSRGVRSTPSSRSGTRCSPPTPIRGPSPRTRRGRYGSTGRWSVRCARCTRAGSSSTTCTSSTSWSRRTRSRCT